jgi:hypothetical protein
MRMSVSRAVRRIVILHPEGPQTIHKGRSKRRKGSKLLKPQAKLARTQARAQLAQASTFLRRTSSSDGRKKDGWLKDYLKNSAKAQRQGNKVWRRAYL